MHQITSMLFASVILLSRERMRSMQLPEQNSPDDFWDDPFHMCALRAGYIALMEGRFQDQEYVKKMAYEFYERRKN